MTHTKAKQIKHAYETYKTSTYYNLTDCYGSFSHNKYQAFEGCKAFMKECCGRDLKVISFNRNFFSVGFICEINSRPAFVYITKSDDKYIFLDEIA